MTVSGPERRSPGAAAHNVHDAARDDDLSFLRSVLSSRPDAVEIENADGEAPLVTAAALGNTAAVKLLLEHGADPCRQRGFALTCACYHGHAGVVQALLQAGADRVVHDVSRWHGLHAACGWGEASKPNVEIVRMLLAAGASSKRKFLGRTPLQYAEEAGRADIVSLLREHHSSRP